MKVFENFFKKERKMLEKITSIVYHNIIWSLEVLILVAILYPICYVIITRIFTGAFQGQTLGAEIVGILFTWIIFMFGFYFRSPG